MSAENNYNFLDRHVERDLTPALLEYGIGLIPFSPLSNGLLTGKYRKDQPPPAGSRIQVRGWERLMTEDAMSRVERLREFCEARSISMVQLAIGGLATQPAVASVIAGATSALQVAENVLAGDWTPSLEDQAELDRITA